MCVQFICVCECVFMGVPCSSCEDGRVCIPDEVAAVKGAGAGLCK